MKELDITTLSAGALSYFGDAVLEILTRRRLLESGTGDAGELNRMAKKYVTAASQSKAYERIKDTLNEEEQLYFKRGRNHQASVPKSASVAEYRRATGMESLFAYLYLTGKHDRMQELFDNAFPEEETEQ